MKLIIPILIILFLPIVLAQSPITDLIQDEANILSEQERTQIRAILQDWYDKDISQTAVVIINTLEGKAIEQAAFDLANEKLGTKEKDNGFLILIVIEDKKYRFEVGKGLEPIFNDAKVGRYGRNFFVPTFQQGKYGEGIILTLNEMNKEFTGQALDMELPIAPPLISPTKQNIYAAFAGFIGLMIFFLIIAAFAKRKHGDDKFFIGALIASQMLRGGGGLGGGFGGFGGGNFGGGGAGGSWIF